MTRTTDEVIDRFNWAFQGRDATLLEDIIVPVGTRYEGYDASFSSWKALIDIDDATSHFEVEDVDAGGEGALIGWCHGSDDSVRVVQVVDGKIVEAGGYSKTAPMVAALENDR